VLKTVLSMLVLSTQTGRVYTATHMYRKTSLFRLPKLQVTSGHTMSCMTEAINLYRKGESP